MSVVLLIWNKWGNAQNLGFDFVENLPIIGRVLLGGRICVLSVLRDWCREVELLLAVSTII